MKTKELSVGKVLMATDSAIILNPSSVILSGANGSSLDASSGSAGLSMTEASGSAQASASATPKADATIGSGTILAGQTSVFINNNQVTNQSKVFITAESPISQTLAVTEKNNGVGFKVEIKLPEVEDIKFSYWIIN